MKLSTFRMLHVASRCLCNCPRSQAVGAAQRALAALTQAQALHPVREELVCPDHAQGACMSWSCAPCCSLLACPGHAQGDSYRLQPWQWQPRSGGSGAWRSLATSEHLRASAECTGCAQHCPPTSHLNCSAGTPPYKSLSLLCRVQADMRRRGANAPEEEFHRAADRALEHLSDRIDALLDENDIAGSDLEYGVRQQPSSV